MVENAGHGKINANGNALGNAGHSALLGDAKGMTGCGTGRRVGQDRTGRGEDRTEDVA